MNDRDDRGMILTPSRWPMWPLLPLKRNAGEGRPEVGVVTPDYPNIVLLTSIWQEGGRLNGTLLTIAQLEGDGEVPGIESIRYDDVDSLLEAGWIVD